MLLLLPIPRCALTHACVLLLRRVLRLSSGRDSLTHACVLLLRFVLRLSSGRGSWHRAWAMLLLPLLLLLSCAVCGVHGETLVSYLERVCGCTDGTQAGCIPAKGGTCGHADHPSWM